jgi:hypothetical protein
MYRESATVTARRTTPGASEKNCLGPTRGPRNAYGFGCARKNAQMISVAFSDVLAELKAALRFVPTPLRESAAPPSIFAPHLSVRNV